jgi:hypothetical protein
MKIPKTLKIGGHVYSIECPHEFKERTDCWGHHSPGQKVIQITDIDIGGGKRPESGIMVTFLHELLHAIDSVYGDNIFLGEKGEDNAHRLSEGIFQVLVDNGYLKLDAAEGKCLLLGGDLEGDMDWFQKLRVVRRMKGLGMREVAAAVGISIGYLCDLERGKVKDPGIFKILRLLKYYDMSLVTMMGEYEKDKSESDKP